MDYRAKELVQRVLSSLPALISTLGNLALFRALWGTECLPNLCFVRTMWPTEGDQLVDAKAAAEELPRYWKELIDRGAHVRDFHCTQVSALDIVLSLPGCANTPKSRPIPLRIQVELVDEKKKLDRTESGLLVEGDVNEMLRFQKRLLEMEQSRLEKLAKGAPQAEREQLESRVRRQGDTLKKWKLDIMLLGKVAWERVLDGILSAVNFVFRRHEGFSRLETISSGF